MVSREEHRRILCEWQERDEKRRRDEGFPHESYCTLCGIPFWLYLEYNGFVDSEGDFDWASYFLALRIPRTTGIDSSVCVTGIGQYGQQIWRLPPSGYDIRDVLRGRRPVRKIRFLMNEEEESQWNSFEKIYPSKEERENPVQSAYLMHPRCWDILLQQQALIASPTNTCLDLNDLATIFLQIPLGKFGGGFSPDWTTDYGGPEPFFWITDAEQLDIFPDASEWHFLQCDPGIACGFDRLFASPPLESAAKMSPRVRFIENGVDIFSRLPEEIITEILVLLPSASVRDLQLASRKMASVHLSSRYWRSRFEFPNELCHVKLPPALQNSGQVGGQWVDWRRLCDQLHHPVGKKPGWWRNRKRITALNKQLVKSMSLRDNEGRLKKVEDVPVVR